MLRQPRVLVLAPRRAGSLPERPERTSYTRSSLGVVCSALSWYHPQRCSRVSAPRESRDRRRGWGILRGPTASGEAPAPLRPVGPPGRRPWDRGHAGGHGLRNYITLYCSISYYIISDYIVLEYIIYETRRCGCGGQKARRQACFSEPREPADRRIQVSLHEPRAVSESREPLESNGIRTHGWWLSPKFAIA